MEGKESGKTTIAVSTEGYRGLLKMKHKMESDEGRTISFSDVIEKIISLLKGES